MNRRPAWCLLTMVVSGISDWKAPANGFGLPDQDAFATARGEAFVATADNPSAIYYNPAGMTQLAGDNLRGGLNSVYYQPSFQPPAGKPNSGQTFNSSDNYAWLPQFFFTHSADTWPLSFGLGVYAPYGGKMNWPDNNLPQNTGFRSIAMNGSLKYITINPALALKLSPKFSIGGGVMVNYANMDLEQGFLQSPSPPNFFRFSGDGWSVGYNLGILWKPHEKISFGATLRSSTAFTLKGETESENLPFVTDQHIPAQADFAFPLTVVSGISYRPTLRWNLEFDANYTDWSSFGSTTINQATKPTGFDQYLPVNFGWQASWMFEFGATRYFDNGWHVSAGYVFNENSVPNTYYTPLVTDLDRHFFSAGTGFKGKLIDFDIAYQFGYGPAHTVTGSTSSSPAITGISGETADGTYHFISHAIFVSAGVHF